MLINTRKILATIGLLIAIAGWHCSCFGETITIRYDSVFSPPLPTAENDINTSPTSHSCNNYEFGEVGIYKGNGSYIMFVKNKGYLYNTESLGHIDSVIVSYSSNVSLSAKFGVRFADTIMFEQITKGNAAIKGKSASDTVANNDPESGGYFQLSTSSANCQIVSIKIVYTQGNTQPPIDNIPPKFTTGYPKTDGVDKNKFDLKVKTDEPCTVFYMVASEGETEPTKDELLASDKTISVETKNTEYFATVSGLEPATTYKIYLIAKDMADNVQEDSTTITATTLSAFVKTIALGDIETKYYWGETANIKWTINNIDAATDQDSIIIYKNNQKILKYPIDITSGEADILIGNGAAPDGNTYGTDYKLKIISGNIESELSANFTIVPTITINRLMTDINSGHSDFINDNVRMKGLVTGVKSKALTIQDGMGDFCATYITNNPNTNVEIHDSVYWEVAVSQSSGSIKVTTKQVTIINQKNQPQTPRITELSEIDANNGLKYLVVTIEGVTCQNRVFYKDNDAIHYVNTLFSNSNNYFKENRKFDISGVLNIGAENKKEIWPRSQVPEDFYLYSNDTTLVELIFGGRDALNSDTIVFTNLTINGISATANDAKASLSIRVNNTIIASSEWEGYNFSPLDSVFVTVTAEDGTEKTYKRVIDCKTLNFNTLANNTFGTGETINLSWTSHNIAQISLILEFPDNTVPITESPINADLNEWQYAIPNSMFGEGWIKAVSNGTTLDKLLVNIADTRAPTVTLQNPVNCSSDVKNSRYVSMIFDEPISVAEGAKLIVNDLEFPITQIGDSAAKSFINGLNYSTLYNISLSNNAICDLAGNSAVISNWSFNTIEAPQPDLYFSEYAKGSGSNKYYEIYNPCDTTVDLSRYFVTMDEFKSKTRQQPTILQLSGLLMPNEVLVVINSGASAEIKRMADVSTTKTTDFTGDDLLGLFRKNGDENVLIDVLGPFGNCDVAANWAVAGTANASADKTIVRNVIICGTTDWAESAGTDSLDSQWTVLEQNVLTSLCRHDVGHNAEILRMSIGGIAATIIDTAATVSVEVPYGTDITKLPVTRRISQGAQIFINDSLAKDTIDFSLPVTATVIAGDSINQKEWTITVTMAPKPSSENNILTLTFVETTPVIVTIDTANAIINAVVAFNLDSLKLSPVITISDKAKVPSTLFKSSKGIFTSKTRWDFSVQQTIVVTAQDTTTKIWSINVEKEPEPHMTFSPLTNNTFNTDDIINLSWTSQNVSQISLVLDIQNSEIQLTDSTISANLGEWQYIVPNSMFGNGKLKALRNGIALDSLEVTIADTRAPAVIRRNPTNGDSDVRTSLYVSMVFDEPVSVADNAKLIVGDLEFPVTAVGDTAAKAFVSVISYDSTYVVSLSDNAIRDLVGNNAVIGDWSFSTRTAPQPDLYFSEYAKGSSNNKYYEIYNPCDTAVDLSRYFVTMDNFSSSNRSQATLQLSGWLLPDEVLVVANSGAAAEIKRMADVSTTKTTNFTGDDLLGLFRKDGGDTVLIDVLGPFGNCDVAANWAAAGISNASTNHTIVRNVIICGTTDWTESAGTDSLDSQWTVLDKDDFSSLGRHGIGHGTEILKMSIGGVAATIDSTERIVSIDVPYGINLTEMAVTYRISQGAQMLIGGIVAGDTLNLSQPVVAMVIAGDSIGQKYWTISVNVGPRPSSEKDILSFTFVETTPVSVTIDTANATIDAIVAYNLDSLKLTPVITIAEFASVSSTLFKSSKGVFTAKAKWDFNEPKTIAVRAEDQTEKVWNVRVEREKTQELTIKDIAKLDGGLIANVGKPVITEGIVIHIVTTTKGSELYIQDSAGMWSGIMVVDEGNIYAATLAIGDRIKISGIVEENFGMARIGQIEAITVLNSDIKIHTDTIIVEDALSVAYQNALVTIDSVICTGGFDNLYTVCDSTNSIYIYNKYRISDFTLEVDSMYRITGIVYYTSADNSYRIVPRTADDIVKLARPVETKPIEPNPIDPTPIEPNPIEPQPQEPDTTTVSIVGLTDIGLTAYTAGHTIIIENADEAVIVFDIAGRLIATAKPAQRIVINAPHTGIYIIRTRQKAIKVVVE